MAQHTPGPWTTEAVKTQVGHAHKILPIRACLYVDGRDFRETDEKTLTAAANARLIAAAPDLLAALQQALEDYKSMTSEDFRHGKDKAARAMMRAAIAKAEAEGK